MKNIRIKSTAVILSLVLLTALNCEDTEEVGVYEPVYLSFEELRHPIASGEPEELKEISISTLLFSSNFKLS